MNLTQLKKLCVSSLAYDRNEEMNRVILNLIYALEEAKIEIKHFEAEHGESPANPRTQWLTKYAELFE